MDLESSEIRTAALLFVALFGLGEFRVAVTYCRIMNRQISSILCGARRFFAPDRVVARGLETPM